MSNIFYEYGSYQSTYIRTYVRDYHPHFLEPFVTRVREFMEYYRGKRRALGMGVLSFFYMWIRDGGRGFVCGCGCVGVKGGR